jgi:hypothetical protein
MHGAVRVKVRSLCHSLLPYSGSHHIFRNRCFGYQAVYRVSFVDFFFFLAIALGSKFYVVRCAGRRTQ